MMKRPSRVKKIAKKLVACTVIVGSGLLASAASAAAQGGFSDFHENGKLKGWTSIGGRRWIENSGSLTTLSPEQTQVSGGSHRGFLLSEYPSADNGTFETTLNLDAWNGNAGGIVLRWSSPQSYYFISVKPANRWTSKLMFHVDNMDESTAQVVAQGFEVGATVKLKVEVVGSQFKIYLNDVLRATVNNTAHTYGRVGFGYTSQWNNYVSALQTSWIDAIGSTPSTAVDPHAGRVELQANIMDEAFDQQNIIRPRLYVKNIGEVDANGFDAYYLFTAEPGKTPILEDYYTPESTPSLLPLGDNLWAVEYHFSGFTLAPGATTPDPNGNVVGIHYADWSNVNKSDDFSAPSVRGRQVSDRIPIQGLFRGSENYTPSALTNVLAGGTIPTAKVKIKKLTLNRLRCEDTTADDDFAGGWDSVAVSVTLDSQNVKTINAGDMDEWGDQDDDDPKNYFFDGNGGTDNEYLDFFRTARIEIFDYEDMSFAAVDIRLIDWDTTDYIGSNDLDTSVGQHQAVFNRDGTYRLYYTVEEVEVDKTYTSLADYQVDRFDLSTKTGVWDDVDKATLLPQIRERLRPPSHNPSSTDSNGVTSTVWTEGPGLVYQGGINYCGPAALLYTMIKNRPLRYAVYMREVFEKGVFYGKYHTYTASEDLRKSLVPTDRDLVEADWIAMSTISDSAVRRSWWRDDEVITKGTDGYPTNDYAGRKLAGTYNDDLGIWAKDLLGYNYVDDDSSIFWGEQTILDKAQDYATRGGFAAIAVEQSYFAEGADPTWFHELLDIATHYIAYVGDLDVSSGDWYSWDSDEVTLHYWNHGKDVTKTINEEQLEDSVFGGTFAE